MNQLTYRGINYQPQTDEQTNCNLQTPVDKCGAKRDRSLNRLILIKPMHYYTYRGVNYTKTIISDRDRQILLDLDRQ